MPTHRPRVNRSQLLALLRRVFPEYVWLESSIDVPDRPVECDLPDMPPALSWCAVAEPADNEVAEGTPPLWLFGLHTMSDTVRAGRLYRVHASTGNPKHTVLYVSARAKLGDKVLPRLTAPERDTRFG